MQQGDNRQGRSQYGGGHGGRWSVDGVGGGEFALEYPYDELVAGDYEYRVEVVIDGCVLRPAQSVGYHIGAPSCFA